MRYIVSILLILISTISYARNVDGSIQIDNQSQYSLTKISQTSNKMLIWNFPDTIASATQVIVPVRYDAPVITLGIGVDNAGQTDYQVTCGNGQIENIKVKERLGGGNFSDVYLGEWNHVQGFF